MDGQHAGSESILARPFVILTRFLLSCPWAVIALGIGTAIAALVLTGSRLGYKTSRLDLLNPESDYNRRWVEYINEFGEEDDAVIVVEGAGRERVVPVLEELSSQLGHENRLFHAVLHEVDLRKIRSKGLHYLSPDDLVGIDRFLSEVGPILAGQWSRLSLGNMALGMRMKLEAGAAPQQAGGAVPDAELERLTGSLLACLDQKPRYQSPWPEMPQSFAMLSELNSEYLLTKHGQLGFVLLRLAAGKEGFTHGTEAVDALRDLIAHVQARHPDVKIGLTGLPIMENDEMRTSQSSMFWASLISMVGVACLFVAGFGGMRHALLANAILLIGMAWSFGYATLSVGHLNILSVTFTVTLIGIGIDYGVYYVARYLQLRKEASSCEEALLETSRTAGPAITTGALTTAISFFAAGFTSFTGVAELGIIAGGGILLCAIAELCILPPCLYLMDRGRLGLRMPDPLPVHKWIAPFMRLPRLTLLLTLGCTAALSMGLGRLWYDHNLLNMQAVGLESVELERKLLEECNQSVWYALSISDSREELLARKAKFLKLPSVERTEEIVSLLPADHEVKRPLIERIGQRLAMLPERPPLIPVDKPERLGETLAAFQPLVANRATSQRCTRNLELIRDQLRRMPLSDCYACLSRFQQQMAGDLLSRLHTLRSIANPEPPQLTDLPASLVHRFVGQHGRYLLKIYGRGNIWDTDALTRFVADVRGVDPQVTGNPLQAHEASLEMKKSYYQAAGFSLLIIIGLLCLDFRNLRDSLIAAAPLAVGMLQTFGLLGLLNIPLNPANLIALPLILGIGIDYGVHVVHEFREQTGRYRMTHGTAVAVLVDALTTIVGFGSLMIASHQGLQSLGRVLTLGVTCCLLNSVVLLPAILAWVTRHRHEPQAALSIAPSESPSPRLVMAAARRAA